MWAESFQAKENIDGGNFIGGKFIHLCFGVDYWCRLQCMIWLVAEQNANKYCKDTHTQRDLYNETGKMTRKEERNQASMISL